MADYTDSKNGLGAVFPNNAVDSTFQDNQPLITPDELIRTHLWGLPLYSRVSNPLTRKADIMTEDELKEFILDAVALAEIDLGDFNIFERQFDERHAYDRKLQDSFGYMMLRKRPAASIQSLTVTSTDGVQIWQIPNDWIDTGLMHQGQLNIFPFAVGAYSAPQVSGGPVGVGLLPAQFTRNWVPGFFNIKYTAGFPANKIPRIVNQLIGTIAAYEVLALIATTFAQTTSSSLSLDGLSESQSTPGPNLYDSRLNTLASKRKFLVKKLQRQYGLGFFTSNV